MSARRVLAVVSIAFSVLASVCGGAGYVGWRMLMAPGPLAASRDVVVGRGTPYAVGETLAEAGVIGDARVFTLAAWATRGEGSLHAAELRFAPGASLRDVLTVLRTARPVQHHLTIPEGLTAAQIAALIDRADAASGETPRPPEGMTMPETYAYERGATRASLVARATSAMRSRLAQAWAERAPDLPLTTPEQMLTLASIVERETARPAERPHVAGVFLNRLRLGMKLQSDPTVIYAASGGLGQLDHAITRAELERDDPYNTYRIAGLPPGPIASPGLAALEAVAHPDTTEDLYFVADGTGGHVFARTLEAHNRNVTRWRALHP